MKHPFSIALLFSLLLAGGVLAAGQPIGADSIVLAAQAAWNVTDHYLQRTAQTDSALLDADHRRELPQLRRHGEQIKRVMSQIIQQRDFPDSDFYWIRHEQAAPTPNPNLLDLFNQADLAAFVTVNGTRGAIISGYPAFSTPADSLEQQLADTLTALHNLLAGRLYSTALDGQIERDQQIHGRYERKLMTGFPAAPWEYMLNFHGTADGPSPSQIIWLHPGTGIEALWDDLQNNTWRFQPVLTLQPLGFNYYFLSTDGGLFYKINYLGLAGIVTYNSPGRDVNMGAVVHFGNYLSAGATFGNDQTYAYASSAEAVETVKNLLGRGILLVGRIF
jgi:hypothetical protein